MNTENNKIIAEFMGSKFINDPYIDSDGTSTDFWHWTEPEWPKDAVSKHEYSTAFMIGNWAYNRSLDWLLPVWEKIESMGYEVNIKYDSVTIVKYNSDSKSYDHICFASRLTSGQTLVGAINKCFLEFIWLYNQQKLN